MELARKSKTFQKKQYIERKAEIRRKRVDKMVRAKEKKEKQEIKEIIQKEDLFRKIEKHGGLWKTDEMVDEKLAEIDGEQEKKALRVQIQFRKVILGAKYKDKTVFKCQLEVSSSLLKRWPVI